MASGFWRIKNWVAGPGEKCRGAGPHRRSSAESRGWGWWWRARE
jgi:hypothetical protein